MNKLITSVGGLVLAALLLPGCGGGGGGGSAVSGTTPTTPTSPTVPSGECSVTNQNQTLLTFLNNEYLWYKDMPTGLNAASFASLQETLTAAKAPQDRFSFQMSVADYDAVFNDANLIGFGFSNQLTADQQALVVRFVFDNGGAFSAGLARGDKITEIGGVPVSSLAAQVSAGSTTWTDIFGPRETGFTLNMTFVKPDGSEINTTMIKTLVDTNTVMAADILQTTDKKVGYLVFDSFIERSRQDLNDAFETFAQANIQELVLDLRYNGGGFVDVANQLASQIAGNAVANKVFNSFVHNDKLTSKNSTLLFSLGQGSVNLDLDRVVVLTTPSTCSASELVINALAPFIDVVTVGETTCGKPVGMYPEQICDSMVFAINFQTVNAVGDGSYFDGLTPNCFAQEVIVADWGSFDDPLLKEAMFYLDNNRCFSNNRPLQSKAPTKAAFEQTPTPGKRDRIF